MELENTYTNRAYRKLEHLCISRYYDKYSVGWDNVCTYKQMEKELSYIEQQGSAPLIIETYEALKAIEANQKEFCLKGVLGSSIVLYIMGISEIDPTSVSPKVYPEFCFGLDGEIKLSTEIWVTNKLYEKLVRYFDNYIGEARVRHKHFLNGKLEGVGISDPRRNIGVYDAYEYKFLFSPISNLKSFAKDMHTGDVFEEIMPKTFEEQVKCMCWKSFDNGTWKGNGQELYRSGNVRLDDIIANREDVFEYLIAHNIDKKEAFCVVQDIILGRINRNGWDEETLAVLNNSRIPEWYIKSCEKIIGLSSRVSAIMKLNHFSNFGRKEK